MWSLVASLASSASGILAMLAVVAGLVGLGAFEQHKIDESKLLRLEASYKATAAQAAADSAARQKTIDNAALVAATDQSAKQAALAATLQQELSYAKAHATTIIQKISPSCVPWGAVRLLYAAAHGVPADSFTVPAGQPDDACSPVGWDRFAAAVLHDYGQARANGTQLDQLTALLKQQNAALKEKK